MNKSVSSSALHSPTSGGWLKNGLVAAVLSVVAVLVVQMLALQLWPEIALFKPLDSYVRSAVFVVIPVIGATWLFARLAQRSPQAQSQFVRIAVVVLILSIIPDYLLPVEHKTLLPSTVTAFLHVVAGVIVIATLTAGYKRMTGA